MNCTNCGSPLVEGASFCTNCGQPVAPAPAEDVLAPADSPYAAAADSADDETAEIDQYSATADSADDVVPDTDQYAAAAAAAAAAPVAAATAAQAPGAAQGPNAAPAPGQYQPHTSANAPDYQKQFYEQRAQQGYQQPSYQQPAQPRVFPQPATKRALAMCLYAGLLPMIFGFAVRDKSDEFITHHLNQALVVFLGGVISAFLSAIIIGMLLGIYILVMAIMGMVSAYNGDMNELPLIGKIKIVK